MGVVDSLKQKVSSHDKRESTDGLKTHNDNREPQEMTSSEWVRKGQGSDRSDEPDIRAGSVSESDTTSAMSNPKVAEKVMSDPNRVGSTSQ